ncbi:MULTISPECIES: DUF975 family protein [unclassified Enterococcus]|uniref:DUF975 family protein n=1 Tax=unclassified Enterococcus TaxID=2608891 RepID=UPI00155504CE|nr:MULTISPECIES: DUF975 family protein [unclassified Enterococcus]MBS7576147.1 DUF975 family protein [Enterococcus sp. MMGLQ5-2]MBS7583380.1 DUF975 family protein [Enterococcus sp. MMGLQ5-1]NPD11240.1 DUF975 family protein [Enterococcus sp. MMGLQ5-1]NPD35983.1 DUF975 family protein [Enterococcus sp. MMGLQ5-2]
MKINKTTKELKTEAKAVLSVDTKNKILLFLIPVIWSIFSSIRSGQISTDQTLYSANIGANYDFSVFANPGNYLSLIVSILISFVTTAIIFTYMDAFKNPELKIHPINSFKEKLNGPFLIKVFVTSLLLFVYLMLWALLPMVIGIVFIAIGASGSGNVALIFLAIIAFLCVFAVLINRSFAYSQAFYIYHDHIKRGDQTVSARKLIKESVALMKGEKMNLFILEISFILWILLVLFTFGLASVWVTPYLEMTHIAFYNDIKAIKEIDTF